MIVGVLCWLGLLTGSASAALVFDAARPVSIVTAASPIEGHLAFAPPPSPPTKEVPTSVIEPETSEPTSPWPPEDLAGAKDEPKGLSVWIGRVIPVVLAAVVLVVLWKKDVIRPGSFSAVGRTRRVGSPWFVWVVAAIVVFMAAQMGSALAMVLAGRSPVGAEESSVASMPLRNLAIVSLGSYAAAIVAAVAMGRLLARTAEGFAIRARHLLLGVGCFVAAYPVVFAVSSVSVLIAGLLREGETPRVAHDSLRQIIDNSADAWAWVLAGAAVIGAPIVEEMIYRVFLQTGLLRAFGKPWLAIWITAALFAAAHISVVEPYALPTLFVLGAAMGLAYERTKSPVVPIMMHVLFNGLNVAMAMWLDRG